MEKLISNTEFGVYLRGKEINPYKYTELRENYDIFLSQKLELGMFVPCDLEGNFLEDPRPMQASDEINEFEDRYNEYKEALEKCLFSGYKAVSENPLYIDISDGYNLQFRWVKEGFFMFNRGVTLEKFSEKYNLELTSTALKQIGL